MPEVLQRSFSKGEISPALHARADLRLYHTGLKTCSNFFVHPEGGASTRAGFQWVGQVKDNAASVRLVPFQFNTEQTYVLEFTDLALRVIKDGGYVTEAALNITGVTRADPAVVTSAGHGYSNGDQVYISSVIGMVELNNGWYTVANVTANTFELSGVNSSAYTSYTSGGTVSKLYTVVSPYAAADLADLKYTQSADVMTIVHPDYEPRELSRLAHDDWSFDVIAYTPTLSPPGGLALVAGGAGAGSYDKDYEYVVTAVDADGVESLPSSSQSINTPSLSQTAYVELTWNAVTDAVSYNIYKAESATSNIYGWIGKSETTTHRDYNVAPLVDDSPPTDRQPFSGTGNKPSTVNYYQQRLLFGATHNKPQTIYATQSANYKSFRVSVPTKDDDAITFTIASQRVNEIRHIVALDALIVLTSGGEWKITEGQDDVLTPSTVGLRPQSYFGASKVQPAVVGNSAVYIQERGSRVRDIQYTFESDSYTGSDLSILAQHQFDGHTIVDMAYAQEPYSQLYLLRNDGKLLCCTYHKEHQVTAWYSFETAGTIKSMAVIAEDAVDRLYIAVERTINGGTRRYVERLAVRDWAVAEDAFCVDAGSSYDGADTTSITGLRHLEGETVEVLADGNVVKDLVVANGSITLPEAAGKVHVGLGYQCDLETLAIDAESRMVRGKKKSVAQVVIRFLESRGGYVGSGVGDIVEIKSRYDADSYEAIQLRTTERRFTFPAGWNEDGQVFYRQVDPLPATILAIAPEVAIG